MLSTFTATQFANAANWQGVDDEPIAGSQNLVTSEGVHNYKNLKVRRGYYINPSLKFQKYYKSLLSELLTIPTKDLTIQHIWCPTIEHKGILFVDSSFNIIGGINTGTDANTTYNWNATTQVVPEDAMYICIQGRNDNPGGGISINTDDAICTGIDLYSSYSSRQQIALLGEAVEAEQARAEAAEQGLEGELENKANLISVIGKNLYDKSKNIDNTQIKSNTGLLNATEGWTVSGLIPIIAGETYYLSRPTYRTTESRFVASDGVTPLKPLNPSTDQEYENYECAGSGNYAVKAPSNATYFQFLVKNSKGDNSDTAQFELGDTQTDYEPYTIKKELSHDEIPSSVFKTNNVLFGKKIAYDGDSIARGRSDTSNYAWSPIIANNNKGTYVSLAVSGGTITSGIYRQDSTPRHWICEGIETLYNNNVKPDYIIFEGGTNDADIIGSIVGGNTPPAQYGSWSETGYDGPFDKTTFCGAVEYMFQKALTLFPHAKFGFIIAQKMGVSSDYTKNGSNRRAYFETIMQICKKWGVPYINLWDEGFLCPKISTHCDPNATVEENIAAHRLYVDTQHLTLDGYKVITSKIEAWIKSL